MLALHSVVAPTPGHKSHASGDAGHSQFVEWIDGTVGDWQLARCCGDGIEVYPRILGRVG
jgi:hypothetical protein